MQTVPKETMDRVRELIASASSWWRFAGTDMSRSKDDRVAAQRLHSEARTVLGLLDEENGEEFREYLMLSRDDDVPWVPEGRSTS